MGKHTKDRREFCIRQQLGDTAMVAKAVAERILIDRPLSVQVEGVRVRKDILISIGGLVRCNDALASFDELEVNVSTSSLRSAFHICISLGLSPFHGAARQL